MSGTPSGIFAAGCGRMKRFAEKPDDHCTPMSLERVIELQERAWELEQHGELDQAFVIAREALGLLEQLEGGDSPDVANLLNDLVAIEQARQNFDAALVLAERARHIERGWDGSSPDESELRIRLKTESLLGELQRARGDFARAEAHLTAALELSRALGDAAEIAYAENALGIFCKYAGRFDEALELYARALATLTEIHGERSLEVGGVWHNIGGALHARGDFVAAEGPARRAWEIARQHLGEDDPRTHLDAAAYAAVLDGLERYTESETLYRRALSRFRVAFGPVHYELAATWHNLGSVVEQQGRADEAEGCYREAWRIKRQLFGDDHPDLALTLNNLGRLLCERGRRLEALPLLEAAHATLERSLPDGHPQRGRVFQNLERARTA